MKLSELIAELEKFRGVVDDPEVVYWNAEHDAYENISAVCAIETSDGIVIELSGLLE